MKRKILVIIIIILVIGGILSFYLLNKAGIFFNPGNRYDWENLVYMDVPFTNQTFIHAWNEGYSESDSCPWGFTHNGLDYFFNDSAPVLAMAPGQVWDVDFVDTGDTVNKYHIRINIRFNKDIILHYGFEPWTNEENKARQQLDDLHIKVGDWVTIGEPIASFVAFQESAHIHFDVELGGVQVCPKNYFSESGYNKSMDLIHNFHSTWEMCYA